MVKDPFFLICSGMRTGIPSFTATHLEPTIILIFIVIIFVCLCQLNSSKMLAIVSSLSAYMTIKILHLSWPIISSVNVISVHIKAVNTQMSLRTHTFAQESCRKSY